MRVNWKPNKNELLQDCLIDLHFLNIWNSKETINKYIVFHYSFEIFELFLVFKLKGLNYTYNFILSLGKHNTYEDDLFPNFLSFEFLYCANNTDYLWFFVAYS